MWMIGFLALLAVGFSLSAGSFLAAPDEISQEVANTDQTAATMARSLERFHQAAIAWVQISPDQDSLRAVATANRSQTLTAADLDALLPTRFDDTTNALWASQVIRTTLTINGAQVPQIEVITWLNTPANLNSRTTPRAVAEAMANEIDFSHGAGISQGGQLRPVLFTVATAQRQTLPGAVPDGVPVRYARMRFP